MFVCRRVLEPLIRLLLRAGVSAGEFKSIVDSIYVHQAACHLDRSGEGVNDSRLAVITGLQRRTVRDLRTHPPEGFTPRSGTQLHRASRVLTGWFDDQDFRTSTGEPAILSFSGSGFTFQALVERYGGGVPAGPVLKELLHAGVAQKLPKKHIQVLRRSPEPVGADPALLYEMGQLSGDLLTTFDHNLTAPATAALPVRFLVAPMDANAVPLFRTQFRKRADAMMEATESFLDSHPPASKARASNTDSLNLRVTAGLAVFTVLRATPEKPAVGMGTGIANQVRHVSATTKKRTTAKMRR